MKKTILLFSIIVSGLLLSSAVLAVQPLEVEYPTISLWPSVIPGPTSQTDLPNYARYVIIFLVSASGLIALITLTIGGFEILTSAGDSGKFREGMNRITSAFVGILIVLGFFAIVYAINPSLVDFSLPSKQIFLEKITPGIYICKAQAKVNNTTINLAGNEIQTAFKLQKNQNPQQQDSDKNIYLMKIINSACQLIPSSGNITEDFNDNVKWACSVPSENNANIYGAIIYNGENYNQNITNPKTAIVYNPVKYNPPEVNCWNIQQLRASSIKPFILEYNPAAESSVTLFKEAHSQGSKQPENALSAFRRVNSPVVSGFIKITLPAPDGATTMNSSGKPEPQIGSLKIEKSKGLIVFFFQKKTTTGWDVNGTIIDVYIQGDSDLNGNPMGNWCQRQDPLDNQTKTYPCAPGGMVILSAIIL